MKILVLMEYGIPHYREFIFDYLHEMADDLLVVHTGEDYKDIDHDYKTYRCDIRMAGVGRLGFHQDTWKYIRQYDVVIGSFNFWRPMCWAPAFFTSKKYILWGQAYGRWNNMLSRSIKRWAAKRADAILVYTQRGKKYYTEELQIDSEKVFVTNNTLDIPNHSYTHEDRNYFLYVGRVQRRKHLSEMLHVMADLKKEQGLSGEVFRVVGGGDPAEDLKEQAEQLGVSEHVNFVGPVYEDDELKKHFSGALGYLSPGNVGLGVVHAFSYGIPVITDKNENRAPEFDYCSDGNSFLYEGRGELKPIISQLLADSSKSYQKGKAAYNRYHDTLRAEHTKEAFRQAILR